jgi:hypothetical protein
MGLQNNSENIHWWTPFLINYKTEVMIHNARVKNRILKFKDLVLRNLKATRNRERIGKLAPKWDGPFKVIKVVKMNNYHL